MSDDPKLLPCPFCGAEAESRRIGESGIFVVSCSNPECGVRPSTFALRAEVVEIWNTRYTPAAAGPGPTE
jgi:Lar family restriction alleviation protein